MFEDLNQQLTEMKEKLRLYQKLQDRYTKVEEQISQDEARLQRLKAQLDKEDSDVKKLEGLSLTGLFYAVLGSKEQQLEKERHEYLAVLLKYEECKFALSALKQEADQLRRKLSELGDVSSQYDSLLKQKEKMIAGSNDVNARKLADLAYELGDVRSDIREIEEAIEAGREAHQGLEDMLGSLESARNWGTWDMLGGGLISTAIKHSRIDEARDSGYQVQQLLGRFQRELADVDVRYNLSLDIGSFMTFADYFFDGLITDWLVQSRIKESQQNVEEMYEKVGKIVGELKASQENARQKVQVIEEKRRALIESCS